jgi:hypothetical protein
MAAQITPESRWAHTGIIIPDRLLGGYTLNALKDILTKGGCPGIRIASEGRTTGCIRVSLLEKNARSRDIIVDLRVVFAHLLTGVVRRSSRGKINEMGVADAVHNSVFLDRVGRQPGRAVGCAAHTPGAVAINGIRGLGIAVDIVMALMTIGAGPAEVIHVEIGLTAELPAKLPGIGRADGNPKEVRPRRVGGICTGDIRVKGLSGMALEAEEEIIEMGGAKPIF